MALEKNILFENGLLCDNAYHKVIMISGNKDNLNIALAISKDKTYSDKGSFIRTNYYNFTPATTDTSFNFIKQAYEYLKTLPDFAGATDA